ncbi:hypothetical protein DPSP01_012729 [Paraphaeosphaeria sporulosa]
MSTVTLAITISVAVIFGVTLLWVAIYYLHQYVHRECCKIRDFFTSLVWTIPKQEDYAHERGESTLRHGTPDEWVREEERRRTSEIEWERVERDVEEGKRDRDVRKRVKIRKKVDEWEDSDKMETDGTADFISKTNMPPSSRRREIEEGPEGRGGQRVLLQPCVPAYVAAFVPVLRSYGTPYMPAVLSPPMFPLVTELEERDDGQFVEHGLPPPLPYANEIEEEQDFLSQPHLDVEERMSPIAEADQDVVSASVNEHSASKQQRGDGDVIVIADEYPTYVRERMEERRQEMDKSRAVDSSSSGSSSSSAYEEVPRGPIPTATQRPTFHFPQIPWRTHPPDIPRSYPSQWMPPVEPLPGDLLMYPPYANMGRNSRRERGDGKPGLTSSNTPPCPV